MKKNHMLKLVCKREFEKVRHKYAGISLQAQDIIMKAKPLDVLVLRIEWITKHGFEIRKAEILNEEKEELFYKILETGDI